LRDWGGDLHPPNFIKKPNPSVEFNEKIPIRIKATQREENLSSESVAVVAANADNRPTVTID
jgi:hypothetical protein